MERYREKRVLLRRRAARGCGWRRRIGKRVNMERTDEALATGADVVSTACPFCMIMLDDAVKAHGRDDVEVLDISQVVESVSAARRRPHASSSRPETRR